jgi:hypothetical protein
MPIALQEPATASPDGSGNITFTFGPVDEGSVWTGSIVIDGVSSTIINPIVWIAKDASNIIGKWYNDLPSNSMQARTQVIVTGTNVSGPGPFRAVFYGVQTKLNESNIVWPIPPPAPPAAIPKLLLSAPVSVSPAGTIITIGTFPVAIGTSTAFSAFFVDNNGELILDWSIPGVLQLSEHFTFDMWGGNNLSAAQAAMSGLVLPNVGSQLKVSAISKLGFPANLNLNIFTGLPPITQSPVIPNGLLWSSAGNVPANTTIPILLPPYFGPVSFVASPNNVTGFGVYIIPSDYADVAQTFIRPSQGWPAGTGPFTGQGIIYLPAMKNTLIIDNSAVGAPTNYSTMGVVLGP